MNKLAQNKANLVEKFTLLPLFQEYVTSETWHTNASVANTGGADKSLARPGRKQTTATEDFDFHISYL